MPAYSYTLMCPCRRTRPRLSRVSGWSLSTGTAQCTDVLVLDEVVYVSRRKYRVPVDETLEFIDRVIL